jgi:hypothetical protein
MGEILRNDDELGMLFWAKKGVLKNAVIHSTIDPY